MGFLDETVSVSRRTMVLFFMIDKSGSMAGTKIQAVNDSISNIIPIIKDISDNNNDAEIKIASLHFSSDVEWLYSEPKLLEDFVWQDVQAGGLTSLGAACRELDNKLSKTHGFMASGSGSYAPVVILLSDGAATDDYVSGLKKVKGNNWFKAAIKVAVAIGNDAVTEELANFTGTPEAVFTVHNIEALKQIIRLAAVTSSQVGSQSTSSADTTKQEEVIKKMNEAVNDIDGAVAAPGVDDSSYDEWN
jgi:uncharacterized protein YegL